MSSEVIPQPDADGGQLEQGALSTLDIVFFVLAGVAPLGAIVAILPQSIGLGNGAGVPGTYVVAGVVLALFSTGYVRMSRRVTNAGGFYTFAREGLGVAAGGATAYIALVAYNAAVIGIFGGLAFFSEIIFASLFGINLTWGWWAVIWFVIVAVLAYFEVTMSAKTLALALLAEVALLMVFNLAVLFDVGFQGFSLDVFRPDIVFGSGFGLSLMLAFGSFVGFEAASLYGEEAKEPRKSVPRAVYISLATITLFYLITTWAAISAFGVADVKGIAATDPENFMFIGMAQYVNETAMKTMQVLVITSLFAAFLAFHCNTARYHFALAREGMLPRFMSYAHPRFGSPVAGSGIQLGLVAMVAIAFGAAGKHPYMGMGSSLFGFGVLGIVVLQAVAAASIVGYFLRHRQDESLWAAIIAPALGGLGLSVGLVYMVANYSVLAYGTIKAMNYLPWALPLAAAAGAAVAVARRRDRAGVQAR